MKYKGEEEHRFTMRMPLSLYMALVKEAEEEKRSVCNMVAVLLDEALKKRRENKNP